MCGWKAKKPAIFFCSLCKIVLRGCCNENQYLLTAQSSQLHNWVEVIFQLRNFVFFFWINIALVRTLRIWGAQRMQLLTYSAKSGPMSNHAPLFILFTITTCLVCFYFDLTQALDLKKTILMFFLLKKMFISLEAPLLICF